MCPIQVDPNTGQMISVPDSFVEPEPNTTEPVVSITDAPVVNETKPSEVVSPQMNNLIESATRFNESLNEPPASRTISQRVMVPSIQDELRIILKDNGMDTQQQNQALARISELLLR